MPHTPDLDEGLDPDGPSAADLDRFGHEFTACPNCGQEFYDQSELCPHCGEAMRREPAGLPLWAVITVAVVLAAFALYFVLYF